MIPKMGKRRTIDTGVSCDVIPTDQLLPDGMNIDPFVDYIRYRVGVTPTLEDLRKFQVIGDPVYYAKDFLNGKHRINTQRMWFRCTNGCMTGRMMCGNDVDCERWEKYTGSVDIHQKMLYSIKEPIDVCKRIHVLICEGVFDCIGLYYHYELENCAYIACLGSNYNDGLMYMIERGIYGDSVDVRIMKDGDIDYVKLDWKLCLFFHDVSVYRNADAKDYGIPIDMLSIEKIQNSYESQRRQTK
jgi:hypothetical protein